MQSFTDIADQAVTLPLVLAVALVVAVQGWWRGALAWSLAVPGALLCVLALKFAAYACGRPWPSLWPVGDVQSPSGHAGSAAAVYAGVAVLLGLRWTAVPLAVVVAAGLGASRLALGVHTPGDVVVGGTVGIAAVAALVALVGPRPRRMPRWPLAAAVLVVLAAFHGQRLRIEDGIRDAAVAYARTVAPATRPGLDKS